METYHVPLVQPAPSTPASRPLYVPALPPSARTHLSYCLRYM